MQALALKFAQGCLLGVKRMDLNLRRELSFFPNPTTNSAGT